MRDEQDANADVVEPVTRAPLRDVTVPVSTQVWQDVTFLHWACDPVGLRHLVPAGTRLDVRDGVTWVGLVGLRMAGVRLGGLLPLGHLGEFGEINVRIYTVGADGRRSTVFLAMEAGRLPFVLGARALLRLPYAWSEVAPGHDGDVVAYGSRRRWPGRPGAGVRFSVRVGAPHPPTTTDDFVTARWGLHTPWYGRPLFLPFTHEPWPLHAAELLEFADEGLFAAAGVPTPAGRPSSVLYASRVLARSGPPLPVRPRRPTSAGRRVRRSRGSATAPADRGAPAAPRWRRATG